MRTQYRWGVILLAASVLVGCDLLRAGVKSSYTVERAKVEEVLEAEANGYRFVAYVVTWNSQRVVVSDALSRSRFGEGDEIQFMAQRIGLPGDVKSLDFTLLAP